MLSILHLILAVFFTTSISAEVKVASNGKGLRYHSLDGKVTNEHLLFQVDVSNKLACTSTCLKYGSCVAFSTSPKDPPSKKMTCRGHDSKDISQSSTVDVPGSKTFIMDREPPVQATSWLERPCNTDSDCPATVDNVVCFPDPDAITGQCLCQPGYFYSHTGDNCIEHCPSGDLQSTFLKYPKHKISDNNIQKISNCATLEKGQPSCLSNPACVTLDIFYTNQECFPQSATALAADNPFEQHNDHDSYQRTCL